MHTISLVSPLIRCLLMKNLETYHQQESLLITWDMTLNDAVKCRQVVCDKKATAKFKVQYIRVTF